MDVKEISALLEEKVIAVEFDIIDSTNTEAKRISRELCEKGDLVPRLIIAREQSAGRGRLGRSFLSRADRGIFMSLMYFTNDPLAGVVSVTTAAAAIVAVAIEKVTHKSMRIKWVNDIYNDKGKVCGILAETVPVSWDTVAVVVGIGINIGEDEFPDELRDIASSIGDIEGKEELLVAEIVGELLKHSRAPEDKSYMAKYRERFMLKDVEVNILRDGEIVGSGRVLGVDDDGGLLLMPDGKSEPIVVYSGEVSVRAKR